MPRISIVMSVYNGERWLREAVESILRQTLADFEFIIINDGSTDASSQILESYRDARIRLVHQENHGLIYSLNKGVRMARSQYIARMDADDISMPERLERQVNYLDRHPEVTVVATGIRYIGETEDRVMIPRFSDATLPAKMLDENLFAHGSVAFRKQPILESGGYCADFKAAEDRELWLRLLWRGLRFGVIEEPLYLYRVHGSSICATQSATQLESRRRAQRAVIAMFRRDPQAYAWIDRAALRTALRNLCCEWLEQGHFEAAREAARAMLLINRTDLTGMKLLALTWPGIRWLRRFALRSAPQETAA